MIDKFECIITKDEIREKVSTLSRQIYEDYKGNPNLVLISVLNGSFMFFNDLLHALTLLCKDNIFFDFVKVSSYGNNMVSSNIIEIKCDVTLDLKDKDIIIVEDIIDSGLTINFLKEHFSKKNIKSLKVASLLYKNRSIDDNLLIDYKCFKIDDFFAVGYGLDYKQKYRNLEEVYKYNKNEE